VPDALAQFYLIPWTHHVLLIEKIKQMDIREWNIVQIAKMDEARIIIDLEF